MRVRDLNATKGEIKKQRDRIAVDLKTLSALCASMRDEVGRRYYEEVNRADGKTDGLEEFQEVQRLLKRDVVAINGAMAIILKVQGAEGYDFDEMAEQAEQAAQESQEEGK